MTLIQTNDLKKGARVQLDNGWYATIQDNRKGDVRVATVEGLHTETGSIYAHDIVRVELVEGWATVSHTPKQKANRDRVRTFGF
jgi:hypothetical protein